MKLRISLFLVIFMAYFVFFHQGIALSFEYEPFWFKFEDRARVETWNTFDRSVPRDFDDNYTFYANRLRLGAGYKQELLEIMESISSLIYQAFLIFHLIAQARFTRHLIQALRPICQRAQ